RGTLVVTVVIEEGRQTIVRGIERVGVDAIAAALPKGQLAVGEPLDPEKVEAERQALVSAFGKAGYTRAEVTTEVHTEPQGETDAATVRFVGVSGTVQNVGAIIVQNNFDTRWRVIERELPFKSDSVLDPDALQRGQTNLFKLGLFRSVTVRPIDRDTQSNTSDVAVAVSDKPAGTFLGGAGSNPRDGFRGFGEVRYATLQGLGRRISLRGEASLAPPTFNTGDYLINLGFREPRLGASEWGFRLNVVAQRTTTLIYPYSLKRVAVIPGVERSWFSTLRAGMEVQADVSDVFDLKPDVRAFNPIDEGRLTTIALGPYVVYDGRDDAFVPHRGVFDSLRLRVAPSQLGSQIPFFKFVAQHTQYIPVSEDLTFVYAIRGGWGRAFESGTLVPIQDRFFLGGSTTV